MTMFHRNLIILVALTFLGCDDGPAGSTSELLDDEEALALDGEEGGKFYQLPPRLRTAMQAQQAAALEAIGYASGGDEAPKFSGVILHDEERAAAGARIYVSGHAPEATLIGVDGAVLHRWGYHAAGAFSGEALERTGADFFRRALMLPDGGLFAIFHNVGLVRLDRDSNLLWSYAGRIHHDLDLDGEGNLWTLDREVGIVEWIHPERPVLYDFFVRFAPDGTLLDRFTILECIERSPLRDELRAQISGQFAAKLVEEDEIREKNEAELLAHPEKQALINLAGDVFHTNTLQWLDGDMAGGEPPFSRDRLLICVRNLGRVLVLDPAERRIAWSLPGILRPGLHEPQLLANGDVLLFDNVGPERREGKVGFSELTQVDAATGEVTWSYRSPRRREFHSPIAGTCQRLPNGNTLATSSTGGRAFEVTPGGKVVWDFLSPHRAGEDGLLVAFLPDLQVVDAGWLERER